MQKRGLVVSPPIEASKGYLHIKSSDLDPQELRFSLLFWDKLDFPSNNALYLGSSADVEFLQHCGVLTRTNIEVKSGNVADLLRAAHVAAFNKLDETEPGVWSLATGENSLNFSTGDLASERGALVSLHRAMPVPDRGVLLQDILEFKEKRTSELLALRFHLEAIYGRIRNAGDGALTLRSELDALDLSISDYIKSTLGFGLKWRLASLEASINLAAPIVTTALAYSQGLTLSAAALIGTGSVFTVKIASGLSRARKDDTPFRYVSAYHNALFPSS